MLGYGHALPLRFFVHVYVTYMCTYIRKRLRVKTENKIKKCDKRREKQKRDNKMKRNETIDKKNEEDREVSGNTGVLISP
jgi:hypothetical protein